MKTKSILLLALSMSFATAFAQTEQVLNSDPIDVDGYLAEKQVTDHELETIKNEIRKQKGEVVLNKEKSKGFKELSKTTEKLSETTEEYIDDKKDAQKDIAEYNAKIKCLMEENPTKDCDKYIRNRDRHEDEVTVAQAAPEVAISSTNVEVASTGENPFEIIKLLPYAGGTQYNGEIEQIEAEISAGLRLESNINKRFSMGIGFNYAQLKTEDFANNGFNSNPFAGGYYGFYGAKGREIQFNTMGIDLYGKFFITNGNRFRPYVGAGLGYNRSNMKYTNNSQFSQTGYQFGDEGYKTSYATGTFMMGSEIMITEKVGINLEGAYATGLGSSLSSQNAQSPINSPDQSRLRQLGDEIINANALSIFAGMVVTF